LRYRLQKFKHNLPSTYTLYQFRVQTWYSALKKGKGSLYSIAECRVLELIPVLGSQPAGDVSHKPSSRLPLLSTTPPLTLTTLKRAATNFAAWWSMVDRGMMGVNSLLKTAI